MATDIIEAPQPAAVAPQPRAGGCEQYRALLAQYAGWNVDTMLYAMQKESGCNPAAVGDNYPIAGVHAPSCGLLQVRTIDPAPPIVTGKQIGRAHV